MKPLTRISVALATLCLALAPGALLPNSASAQAQFDASGEGSMLARINAMRSQQGLSAVSRDTRLDAAARAHCADMAAQQQLTHVSQVSGTPADRVRTVGVEARSVAENVALHRSAADAHQALLASEAHRANMLGPDVSHVGLAALPTEHGVYVTQVFATLTPAPVAAAPVPAAPAPAAPAPQLVAPAPPSAEGAAEAPPAPSVQASPTPAAPAAGQPFLEVQPGSGGLVVYERAAPGARIDAYWVYGNGRWWYYPLPEGAQAGQQLQADMDRTGPPAGFPEHPHGAPNAAPNRRAQAYPAPNARPVPPAPPRGRPIPPPPPQGGTVMIDPYRGQISVAPGATFYATPPPPMTGRPTRAWRRAQRQWQRRYRHWQRRQTRRGPL